MVTKNGIDSNSSGAPIGIFPSISQHGGIRKWTILIFLFIGTVFVSPSRADSVQLATSIASVNATGPNGNFTETFSAVFAWDTTAQQFLIPGQVPFISGPLGPFSLIAASNTIWVWGDSSGDQWIIMPGIYTCCSIGDVWYGAVDFLCPSCNGGLELDPFCDECGTTYFAAVGNVFVESVPAYPTPESSSGTLLVFALGGFFAIRLRRRRKRFALRQHNQRGVATSLPPAPLGTQPT